MEASTQLMGLAGLFVLLMKSMIQRGHLVSKGHFGATPVATALWKVLCFLTGGPAWDWGHLDGLAGL